jgi:hypothetical protein
VIEFMKDFSVPLSNFIQYNTRIVALELVWDYHTVTVMENICYRFMLPYEESRRNTYQSCKQYRKNSYMTILHERMPHIKELPW